MVTLFTILEMGMKSLASLSDFLVSCHAAANFFDPFGCMVPRGNSVKCCENRKVSGSRQRRWLRPGYTGLTSCRIVFKQFLPERCSLLQAYLHGITMAETGDELCKSSFAFSNEETA
jgi:hypothetical protein